MHPVQIGLIKSEPEEDLGGIIGQVGLFRVDHAGDDRRFRTAVGTLDIRHKIHSCKWLQSGIWAILAEYFPFGNVGCHATQRPSDLITATEIACWAVGERTERSPLRQPTLRNDPAADRRMRRDITVIKRRQVREQKGQTPDLARDDPGGAKPKRSSRSQRRSMVGRASVSLSTDSTTARVPPEAGEFPGRELPPGLSIPA